jgi:hypothetical protein
MLLLTFGVPVIVGVTWFRLSRREPYRNYPSGFPLFMLLGIWALGPLAIAATMQVLGGRFLEPDQLQGFWLVWAAFPATTFIMATYSGSLGGLIITTFLLLVVSIIAGFRHKASNKPLKNDLGDAARPSAS